MDFGSTIKGCLITLGGIVGYLFGGFDTALKTFLILMVIDYITGLIAAGYQGEIDSMIAYKGILKKFLPLAIICIAHLMDQLMGTSNDMIRIAALFFYISMEGISIIENVNQAGVPFPAFLLKFFAKLREASDGGSVDINHILSDEEESS